MAIQSWGYPPLIAPGEVWANMQKILGRHSAVPGFTSCRVTIPGTGTRRVTVATGFTGGAGILDYVDTPVNIDLPNATGASQWFCIVVNRWVDAGGGTFRTEIGYVAGTSARAVPALTQNPGVFHQDPIALVRISSTQTLPQEIVDLRLIAEEPGTYTIYDDLAMTTVAVPIANRPGVQVYNATTGLTYVCTYDNSGNRGWRRLSVEPGRLLGVYNLTWEGLTPSGSPGLTGVRVWGGPNAAAGSTQRIAYADVPDPGVPFRVSMTVGGWFGNELNDGSRYDFDFNVGSTRADAFILPSFYYNGYKWFSTEPSSQIFTGVQQVRLTARKIYGSGYGAISTDSRQGRVSLWEA